MALYSDKVMDHFQHPRNVGKLDDADGIGEVGNAKCGDIMRMYIKVKDGVITDCKFNTFGCGSAIATSSMATELIKGKPISEALELSNKAVVEALDGLPAHKIHCSVLAEEAVRAAVKDYYDRKYRRFLCIQVDKKILHQVQHDNLDKLAIELRYHILNQDIFLRCPKIFQDNLCLFQFWP